MFSQNPASHAPNTTAEQEGKHVLQSRSSDKDSDSVHRVIPVTGETQMPTPVTPTQQLPPNLAYDKGSTETASLVEQFYLH